MTLDLFAGVAVSDLPRAVRWFDRLFGEVESFEPNDTERVWTLTVASTRRRGRQMTTASARPSTTIRTATRSGSGARQPAHPTRADAALTSASRQGSVGRTNRGRCPDFWHCALPVSRQTGPQ